MALGDLSMGVARLEPFHVVQARDPTELDTRSAVSDRLPASTRAYRYRLIDRALFRSKFDSAIFSIAIRESGGLLVCHSADRFATEVHIESEERNLVGFTMMRQGAMCMTQNGNVTNCFGNHGAVFRTTPGTRVLTDDHNERSHLFIQATEIERALEHLLDDRLSRPLEFAPSVDWSGGLAASLKSQFEYVMGEFQRTDGVADNPAALATMTDLLTSLALRGVAHNYIDRLDPPRIGPVPFYVRRAEEFMRANAAAPIRMADVAEAAGCSVRTLTAVFRRFRDTGPLHALHSIRLEQANVELRLGGAGASVATIAQRYGFTNAARFAAVYRRRFQETPTETLRRAL